MDTTVTNKIDLLHVASPFSSAIDFGGMWRVDGLYAIECVKRFGAKKVYLVDTFESTKWLLQKRQIKQLKFVKGDFGNTSTLAKIPSKADLGICYDILLHQVELYTTLKLITSKIAKKIVVAQPVLKEHKLQYKNSLVFLPGSKEKLLLRPHWKDIKIFDIHNTNTDNWIWGMTPSILDSLFGSLGWKKVYNKNWSGWFANKLTWEMYGAIYERQK